MVARAYGCDESRLRSFLDDELPEREHGLLSDHLETCAACRHTLERLAAGSRLWDELRDLAPGPRIRPRPAAAAGETETYGTPEHALPTADREHALEFLASSDAPGSLGRLGPYEVTDVLGSGGFGVVLKAFDPALGRAVAIKVLAPSLATGAAARSRFAREARAAAAVVHDHAVAIHAVQSWNGVPYLVMPYIAGCSLQERVDRDGPMDVKEVLRIGMQTAQGLAAAHAQGLVHRDVKPSNILLENGVERVKLTDFGLARAVDDASLTQSGVVAGTPQYMSPEQACGEAVDHRSDLFSLGSVLYFMCAGRPPFRADSTPAVLRRVSESHPRPIREVNPEVPLWLAEIIERLYAKSAAARFPSAAEVAVLLGQNLAALQRGLPIEATRPKPVTASRTGGGRKTTITAFLSISAIALVVASLARNESALFSLFPPAPEAPPGAAPGAQEPRIVGSGNPATKTWDVVGFTRLKIGSTFRAQIAKGTGFKVATTADDNILPYVRVSKEGTTIEIGLEHGKSFDMKKAPEVEITLPTLVGLDLSGASAATLKGFQSEKDIELRISGASKLDGSIEVEKLDVQVGGACTVTLTGKAKTAKLSAQGASQLKLDEFPLYHCDVELEGASTARLTVRSESLFKAKVSGASRLSGKVRAEKIDLELDRASQATLAGTAKEGNLSASGASRFDLTGLVVQSVDVTLSGTSSASVDVKVKLRYDLSSASQLKYSGDPKTLDGSIAKGSTISRQR